MPPGIVVVDVVDFVDAATPDDPAAVDLKIVPEFFYKEYVPPAEEVPPAEDATADPFQPGTSTFSQ
jgi:hypothetical protein